MPPRHATLPRVPRVLSGMGRLVWLEVELPNGRIRRLDWPDRGAPVVAHAGVSPSARGKARPCFLAGGNARLDRERLRVTRARANDPPPSRRLPLLAVERAHPRAVRDYARTHGGLAPREAVAVVPPSGRGTVVGRVVAVTYRANKNEHGGSVLYRHPYQPRARATLVVDAHGRPQLLGGRATVTPHGIEDLE